MKIPKRKQLYHFYTDAVRDFILFDGCFNIIHLPNYDYLADSQVKSLLKHFGVEITDLHDVLCKDQKYWEYEDKFESNNAPLITREQVIKDLKPILKQVIKNTNMKAVLE